MSGGRFPCPSEAEMHVIRQEAMSLAGIGLYRYRPDGTIVFMDASTLRILELEDRYPDPSAVIGLNIASLIQAGESGSQLREQVCRHGKVLRFEYPFQTLGGRWKCSLHDAYVVRDPLDGSETIQVVVRDITERRRVEDELRRSEHWNRVLLEANPDMMFRYTRDGVRVAFKPGRGLATLRPPEESLGKPLAEILPVDTAGLIQQAIEHTLHSRQTQTIDYRLDMPDGPHDYEGRMVVCGEDEVLLIVREVSDRKRVERELVQSEARYRTLFEASTDAIFLETLQGKILDANASACQMLGYCEQELIGMHVRQIVPADVAVLIPEFIREQRSSGALFVDSQGLRKDGTIFPTEVNTRVVTVAGEPMVIAYVRDITQRKQTEQALQQSEVRLRQIIDLVPHLIFVKDRQGRFILGNHAIARAHGTTPEGLVGKSYAQLRGAELEHGQYLRDDAEVIETGAPKFIPEEPFTDAEGVLHWLQTMKIPYVVSGLDEPAVLGVAIDITERKRAEQEREQLENQLRQSQKMDALGQLAGGVAHDFNNLLTAVMGSAELALEQLPADGRDAGQLGVRRCLEEIQQAGQRAASLTRQLLTFSRKQVTRPEPLDPNRLVADLEKLLSRLIGEHIELTTDLSPGVAPILADAAQMDQVLLNLALNARDAMPGGGRLHIETRNVRLDAAYAARQVDARPGPHVMIAVSDTGSGIAPAIQGRIFEPFFTTKPVGRGTGLGLSIVYGIVRQAGGHIALETQPGRGTTFRVYLPQAEAHPQNRRVEQAFEQPRGQETILLCEDDPLVRRLACRVLETSGYQLIEADNGEEALALAAEHEGPIHLLVTDVVMPGMNGCELADQLTVTHPGMRVLLVSGYTSEVPIGRDRGCDHRPLLEKPFSPAALLSRVREVLDSGRA